MPKSGRYVVRIYGSNRDRRLAGILEDARTGAETPFKTAGELVSLLCKIGSPSSQSVLPKGGSPINDLPADAQASRRRVKKEDKS